MLVMLREGNKPIAAFDVDQGLGDLVLVDEYDDGQSKYVAGRRRLDTDAQGRPRLVIYVRKR